MMPKFTGKDSYVTKKYMVNYLGPIFMDLKTSIKDTKKQLEKKIDGVDQKVDGLDKKFVNLDQKVDGLGSMIKDLGLKIDSVLVSSTNHDKRLSALEIDVKQLKNLES